MPIKKPVDTGMNPNKLSIKLGYSLTLILPFDKGTQLLDSLEYAEIRDESNYEAHTVIPYKGDINVSVLSDKDYKNMKADALLIKDKK